MRITQARGDVKSEVTWILNAVFAEFEVLSKIKRQIKILNNKTYMLLLVEAKPIATSRKTEWLIIHRWWFGFINIQSHEGLTLETSALETLAIYIINLVDKT